MPSSRFPTTFQSLRNPNFRRFIVARVVANIGAWIQITAENWLVLRLSGSGLALGVTNALQFGPLLLLGLYGGVVADRMDRRRLLIMTQSALAVLGAAVGLLVIAGLIQLWMVWGAALLFGLVTAFDRPALQAFVKDLAGEVDLANAIALNNAVVALGRMIGPAIGGLLIASVGLAPGFFLNAISSGFVVIAFLSLDRTRMHASQPTAPKPGQIGEGLSYIRSDPVLMCTVVAMLAVFSVAYNFQVMVPLLASRVLGGSSGFYGALMSCLGFGAVSGSLLIASWARSSVSLVATLSMLLGLSYAWLAAPFGPYAAFACIFLLGTTCGLFNVTVSRILQHRARDDLRGRVMAVYTIGILGTALIGAPMAGILSDVVGVPVTCLLIAVTCLGTAVATASAWSRLRQRV